MKAAAEHDPSDPEWLPGKQSEMVSAWQQIELRQQKFWMTEPAINWTTILPDKFQHWWSNERPILLELNTLQMPRRIITHHPSIWTLHVFCDASQQALAANVYLRTESETTVECNLLYSKCRLAPTRNPLTTPRLEVTSTLVGARMAKFVQTTTKLPLSKVTIWTDSTAALGWINDESESYRLWVTNRTKEIRDIMNKSDIPYEVRYVPTAANVADLCTRPHSVSVEQLKDPTHEWWRGPAFLLQKSESSWPSNIPNKLDPVLQNDVDNERKRTDVQTLITHTKPDEYVPLQNVYDSIRQAKPRPIRSSTPLTSRLLNVFCYFLKFIAHVFGPIFNKWPKVVTESTSVSWSQFKDHSSKIWSAKFTEFAMHCMIRMTQQHEFSYILNNHKANEWHQLRLYLDDERILRVAHRFPTNSAHVLIHQNSALTKALVHDQHSEVGHMAMPTTLAALRAKGYWIPRGRQVVKQLLRDCYTCKRQYGKPYAQPAAPVLPPERITEAKPFERTAIDFYGPILVKHCPGSEPVKSYTLIATCMVVRAVHLEYLPDLSTKSFLNAFIRFCSRRGTPKYIYSDNASTFKSFDAEVKKAADNLESDPEVLSYFGSRFIHHYIVPRASWMNGVVERMVQCAKRALKASIPPRKQLTIDEYTTASCMVEAAINSRPVTYVETDQPTAMKAAAEHDPSDPEWLPGKQSEMVSAWQQIELRQQKFWKQWRQEYLPFLRERKLTDSTKSSYPHVGDIVLISEPDRLKRGEWMVGRVIELIPSKDGEIRSCVVRQQNGNEIARAVCQLYPIETERDINTSSDTPAKQKPAPTHDQAQASAHPTTLRRSPRLAHAAMTLLNLFLILTSSKFMIVMNIMVHMIGMSNAVCELPAMPQYWSWKPQILHVESCKPIGYVVFTTPRYGLCSALIRCDGKSVLGPNGTCTSHCPYCNLTTNFDCIWPPGDVPDPPARTDHYLQSFYPAQICSETRSKNCSHDKHKMTFYRLNLIDGSSYLVDSMQTQTEETTSNEYVCVLYRPPEPVTLISESEMLHRDINKTTGTNEYCSQRNCAQTATAYCFKQHVHNVYYITPNHKIPLQSWGAETKSVYTPQTHATHCETCTVTCGPSTISLTFDSVIDEARICVRPEGRACVQYKFQHTVNNDGDITLPIEFGIIQTDTTATFWSRGKLVTQVNKTCPSTDICSIIQCSLCRAYITNLQCAGVGFYVTWSLFVSSMTCFLMCVAAALCHRFAPSVDFTEKYTSFIYNLLCCKQLTVTQRTQIENEEQNQPTSITMSQLMREENRSLMDEPTLAYQPQPLYHSRSVSASVTLAIILSMLTTTTMACDMDPHLIALDRSCTNTKQGTNCSLTEVARFNLEHNGQKCIQFTDKNGKIKDQMRITLTRALLRCQKQRMYYTRQIQLQPASAKRCRSAGSCTGDYCEKVQHSTRIPELESQVHSNISFSYCVESCGCITCGCGLCSPGCLLYTIFPVTTTPAVYEIFRCPIWRHEYHIEIASSMANFQKVEAIISPAHPTYRPYHGMTISLIAANQPNLPVLSSSFITDGIRTATADVSPVGAPNLGQVGMLQCPNHTTAQNENLNGCYMNNDYCTCTPVIDTVSCNCPTVNIEKLFSKPDSTLPLDVGPVEITPDRQASIYGEMKYASFVEIQISLENLQIIFENVDTECTVKVNKISGCYACVSPGAIAEMICSTSTPVDNTIAHVTCDSQSFTVQCSTGGFINNIALHYDYQHVHEQCTVECGSEKTRFEMQATLAYISPTLYADYSRRQTEKVGFNSQFEVTSLLQPLQSISGMMTTVITIIIIIIIFPVVSSFLKTLYN
jgi:hypothetical protein